MSLTKTFDELDFEIKNGLKFKAVNRLRNLIKQNPDEIQLRSKLAELYYESGFLDEAGKFWVLNEPTNDRIKKCVSVYENSVNHSGCQILLDITFQGDKSKLSEYAQNKLAELEFDSKEKTGYVPKLKYKFQQPKEPIIKYKRSLEDKMGDFWAIVFLSSLSILIIIGGYTVFKWLFL